MTAPYRIAHERISRAASYSRDAASDPLWSCGACGACITEDAWPLHDSWHAAIVTHDGTFDKHEKRACWCICAGSGEPVDCSSASDHSGTPS